jgi:hypothetical protein
VLKALVGDQSAVPAVVIDSQNPSVGAGGGIVELLTSPSMILGLVAAAVLLAAVVWVRRYRDETI